MEKIIKDFDFSRFKEYEQLVRDLVKELGFKTEKKRVTLRPGDRVLMDNLNNSKRTVITRKMYKRMYGYEIQAGRVPTIVIGTNKKMIATTGDAGYYWKDGVQADKYEDDS